MATRVLVTGAAGHMGSYLCRALLDRGGYDVRASVRSLDDADKVGRVRALGDLEVVGLDARDGDAFARALDGVEILFHVAAPYVLVTGSRERDEAMVREGVQGAETAMRAAARARVRKVVLTSSIVTLPLVRKGDPPATEDDWATDLAMPYFREKVEAERAAWRLAEELGVHLVTVLPGGIGGPFQSRTSTVDLFEGILLGNLRFGAPDINFTWVDVRDCAEGHVLAAEKDVRGRFVVTNDENPSFREFSELAHQIDPAVPAAPFVLPDWTSPLVPVFDAVNAWVLGTRRVARSEGMATQRGKVYCPSNARARRELGWEPKIPLRESLAEFVRAVKALRRAEGKTRFV